MKEEVFFDSGDISVSNNRFVVYGKAYAMGNITSVKTRVTAANKVTGILLGLIALFVLFAAKSFLWGAIITVIAVLALIKAREKYSVVLNTSSGENQALSSKNKTHIEEIVLALNEAIMSRG